MIRPKSLQQRFAIFMLLPVAFLLLAMGIIGFVYARNSLLDLWRQAALLKLERAAHRIDMGLSRPKDLLKMLSETAAGPIRQDIFEDLEAVPGVVRVGMHPEGKKSSAAQPALPMGRIPMHGIMHGAPMMFHSVGAVRITPPRYDATVENQTVSVLSDLKDESGRTIYELEVVLRFDSLMKTTISSGWWQSHTAFIVDDAGNILTGAKGEKRLKLGESGSPIELAILKAMSERLSGTVLGSGHPPENVGGFHRLEQANWSLVMVAPGEKVLAPIIRFRLYYFALVSGFIIFILLLIRSVIGRTVSAVRNISDAANQVAHGRFDIQLPVLSRDEVGELSENFNTMVRQLEERIRLKKDLGLAQEVQQSLLPKIHPLVKGFDISGKSVYCDETGGDYFDFIESDSPEGGRKGIVVGDVAGHGLPSALLMTSVRAMLRQRAIMGGNPGHIVADVNRQTVKDVGDSGRFVTLFYLAVAEEQRQVSWVRAGHDPALLYDRKSDSFQELGGKGLPLGIDADAGYQENRMAVAEGQIILIGTDGIWETRGGDGELFGKEAFKETVRRNAEKTAEEIIDAVFRELKQFRLPLEQEDDITLVVLKISGAS